ncbi:MAG: hypothetical protein MJK11_20665 [Pseudomonadales bacterium]|nr:hypothetical protein [Pseudomonadales bacterium]
MDLSKLHTGMMISSKKGDGHIISIDREPHTMQVIDFMDNHEFEVGFEYIKDDPQVHNPEGGYY